MRKVVFKAGLSIAKRKSWGTGTLGLLFTFQNFTIKIDKDSFMKLFFHGNNNSGDCDAEAAYN